MIYGLVIAGGIVLILAYFALSGRGEDRHTQRRDNGDGSVSSTGGDSGSLDDDSDCDADSGSDGGSDGGGGDGGGGGGD